MVLGSAILLGSGIGVELVVRMAPFALPSIIPALLSALAAFSVLFAVTLLGLTFLVSLLPGVSRHLWDCRR